uniref:Uncharacterized protein n=1 Tax=Aegilops tauschii subsp. strangulata TaxID=200361 RepID=A0A453NQY6_AEGTS
AGPLVQPRLPAHAPPCARPRPCRRPEAWRPCPRPPASLAAATAAQSPHQPPELKVPKYPNF